MRRTLGVSILAAAAILVSAAQAQGPAAPADGGFIEAPEKAMVERVCTGCHVAGQVTSQKRSADAWSETVEKMISYGAAVSDEEFPSVVSYLAKYYGE